MFKRQKEKRDLMVEKLIEDNADLWKKNDDLKKQINIRRDMFFEEQNLRVKVQKEKDLWNHVAIVLAAIIALLIIIGVAMKTDAATVNRYTTQKVNLLNKVKGKTVYKVKRNTKVKLLKEGNTWARVRYKGEDLSVKKKYLNTEKLPGKKKAKYYINYLHTKGPVHWHGRKYTYYTSRLCPIYKLPVPGLHLDKNGMWCDKWDYIVLGSSVANKVNRTVYATPFGKYGRVYDTGGYSTPSWLCDTACNW